MKKTLKYEEKYDYDVETQKPLLVPDFKRTDMVISLQPTRLRGESHLYYDLDHPAEDICMKLTGEWGWWQLRTSLIVFLTKIPAAWFMSCIIFVAPEPRYGEFKCDLAALKYYNNFSQGQILKHPTELRPDGTQMVNYCKVLIDIVDKEATTQQIINCEHFIFHLKDGENTVISEFHLVCSRSILIAISQCCHLFGVFLGGILAFESMAFFSPRRVMLFGIIFQIIFGISISTLPTFWTHIAFRCMVAASSVITFTAGNVIMLDISGPSYKKMIAANFEVFWSIGVILMTLIGYFVRNWRWIYIAISLPSIGILILWWFLPDSPIWHLRQENFEYAKEIILNGRAVNKSNVEIPSDLDRLLSAQSKQKICEVTKDLFSSWSRLFVLRRAIATCFCLVPAWALAFTTFYGTLLNVRSFGREHIFYTVPIAGFCEIIGNTLGFLILMKIQHLWLVAGLVACVSGVGNLFIWLLPSHSDGSHMFLDLMSIQMVNKIGVSCILCVLYTCSYDLFPAHHKRRVVYGCIIITRIIFLSAPLIGFMAVLSDGASLSAFGCTTIACGALAMTLKPVGIRDITRTTFDTETNSSDTENKNINTENNNVNTENNNAGTENNNANTGNNNADTENNNADTGINQADIENYNAELRPASTVSNDHKNE